MAIKHKLLIFLFGQLLISCFIHSYSFPQTNENSSPQPHPKKLTLVDAVMCEGIKEYSPINPAIAFSIEIGRLSCFSSFDPVPEEMYIYQKWYYKDKLSTNQRLLLKPPRWSTFSSIQLREADKGPWRVEIIDHEGNLLKVLRFSIVK